MQPSQPFAPTPPPLPPDLSAGQGLPTVPVLPPARRPVRPDTARWLLWGILVIFALAVAGGLSVPHAGLSTHLFDTLFPPAAGYFWWLAIVAAVLTLPLIFSSRLRIWFGAGFLLRPLRFPLPGALALAGGGLLMMLAAALLAGVQLAGNSAARTPWSLPIALGAWATLVIVLGFVACRLALAPLKPLRWYSAMVLGWLVLAFSFGPLTGPFGGNPAPALLLAARTVPGLLADPATQHLYRIYLGLDLTRTNPFFLPFAAFWAGAGLAVIRALDRRGWVLLATTALWSVLALLASLSDMQTLDRFLNITLVRDARTWAVAPLFPAAVLFVLLSKLGLPERACWALAGLLFGILALGTWGAGPVYFLMALLAPAVLLLGMEAGRRVAQTLAEPTMERVRALLLAAVLIPAALGLLDLTLRLAVR